MNKVMLWSAVLAAALLSPGCAGQKGPAEKAVADAEAALSALRTDASQYATTELQQADSALVALQDNLAKRDYKAVITAAPELTQKISALQQTVATRRAEMEAAVAAATQKWPALSDDLSKMTAAIQGRIDVLAQSKKLPKNLTPESYQAAREGLEFINNQWTEAGTLYGTGDAVNAVAKAEAAQARGKEVLGLLGMSAAGEGKLASD